MYVSTSAACSRRLEGSPLAMHCADTQQVGTVLPLPSRRPLPRKFSLFPALPRPQGAGLNGKGMMASFLSPCQHSSILLRPCEAWTGSLCLALEAGVVAGSTAQLGCFACCMLCHFCPGGARGHFRKSRACSLLAPWVLSLLSGSCPSCQGQGKYGLRLFMPRSWMAVAQKPSTLQCHCVS